MKKRKAWFVPWRDYLFLKTKIYPQLLHILLNFSCTLLRSVRIPDFPRGRKSLLSTRIKAKGTLSPVILISIRVITVVFLHDRINKFSFHRPVYAQEPDDVTAGRLSSVVFTGPDMELLDFLTSLSCSSFSISWICHSEPAQLRDQEQDEHLRRISKSDIWKHLTSSNSDI